MKRGLMALCVLIISGCAHSQHREAFRLETEIRSPDGFSEKPKYEVVGRVTWEIRR